MPSAAPRARRRAPARPTPDARFARFAHLVHRTALRIAALRLPRGSGTLAALLFVAASAAYGAVQGGHLPAIRAQLQDIADAGARAFGFGVATVAISGRRQIGEAEVRRAAGIGPGSSVLFLDVAAARAGLLAVPWIAEATVRKLYPDRIVIDIVERAPFALWQRAGKLNVIAADGSVIAPAEGIRHAGLPLVVGVGADRKAKEIVAALEKHPTVKAQTRAAVLVAERRWNLRLANGIDVRLPEEDPEAALAALAALDRDKKLLSRDVLAIDLRLPDRVGVRLSDEAAKAREETIRARAGRRKGSDT